MTYAAPVNGFGAPAVGWRRRWTDDSDLMRLVRFAAVGGLANVVYALTFLLLDGLGDITANLVGSIVSAVLANELHRRLTFRTGAHLSWLAAQWKGGGLSAASTVITSVILAGSNAFAGDLGATGSLLLIVLASAAIGLLRFLSLRWLFVSRTAGHGERGGTRRRSRASSTTRWTNAASSDSRENQRR